MACQLQHVFLRAGCGNLGKPSVLAEPKTQLSSRGIHSLEGSQSAETICRLKQDIMRQSYNGNALNDQPYVASAPFSWFNQQTAESSAIFILIIEGIS